MSLLSKKIALSVTPAGATLSCSDVEAFMQATLGIAMTRWTGRSNWSLTCDEVVLQPAKVTFNDKNETDACLIKTDDQAWLIHFDVPQSLEKMATANALGIASGDISEALKGFSKVHSRVLAHTFFENIEGTVTEDTAEVQWMSPKVTKIHCLQAPETWFCVSVWTAYDAVEEKEYSLTITLDRRVFPDIVDATDSEKRPPDLHSLEKRLGPCRLPVRVVGGNVTLSIADCMKLEIGQIFGLPEIDFNAVDMKMPSSDDILVQATLGNHFGSKAVRLSSGIHDDFLVRYAAELEPS